MEETYNLSRSRTTTRASKKITPTLIQWSQQKMRMHEGHAARISVLRQRQRMLQDGGTRIYPYCRVHSHLIAKSLISTTPLPPSQVCQLMHHRHNFSPQRDSQRSLKQVQCRNSRSIQRKVLPMYLYQCHILNLTRSNSSNRGITNACMDRKWDTFRDGRVE